MIPSCEHTGSSKGKNESEQCVKGKRLNVAFCNRLAISELVKK